MVGLKLIEKTPSWFKKLVLGLEGADAVARKRRIEKMNVVDKPKKVQKASTEHSDEDNWKAVLGINFLLNYNFKNYIQRFFKESRHPDHEQQCQLGKELGIEPEKIKFWFQNRRTQLKVINERASKNALQIENEKIRQENFYLSKAIEISLCRKCLLLPDMEDNRSRLDKLKIENAKLHLKIYQMRARLSAPGPLQVPNFVSRNSGHTTLHNQLQHFQGRDKSIILGIAANAIDEATRLLKFSEPLWVKNPAGRYVLDHESYIRIFPKPGLENFDGFFESSKDNGLVRMSGKQLVDVFLDAGKWAEFFSTILIKAETIQEFDSGTAEIRDGCLKLMYAKMHILSHLVAARELFFVRYCQQMGEGVWVITDVTDDYFFNANQNPSPSWCWRLPSGCMIQDMSNGWSKVTWMEHTKFKENVTRHPLYKDYVNHESAYGAERWLATLQRTCERFAYSMIQLEPNQTLGGLSSEGRRTIMSLSKRMIKNFCESLAMNGNVEFPDVSNSSDSGVQISVHNSIQGQPDGIIATATASFWLPQPFQTVFNFLMDKERRPEWDVLSGGKTLQETMNISCGTHPGNCISILQPHMPDEPNFAMLQETYIGPLGSLQVYAPINLEVLKREISTGQEHSPNVLPSGFLVSRDGYFGPASSHISTSNIVGSNCSLTTMAYQVLIGDTSNPIDEQSIATIKAVTRAATQKIKKALGCDELDP